MEWNSNQEYNRSYAKWIQQSAAAQWSGLLLEQQLNVSRINVDGTLALLVPGLLDAVNLSFAREPLTNHINADHRDHREQAQRAEGGHLKCHLLLNQSNHRSIDLGIVEIVDVFGQQFVAKRARIWFGAVTLLLLHQFLAPVLALKSVAQVAEEVWLAIGATEETKWGVYLLSLLSRLPVLNPHPSPISIK
jgi:hypothetical protein